MLVNLAILKAELGGIQTKLNFDTVVPFVKAAERQFRNSIGVELYQDLQDPDTQLEELGALAKSYISWTAYDMAMPHLKFRVGDMGLMKSAPQNTTSITKWEYVDSKEANLAMADFYLEQFWQELEELKPSIWTNSEAYQTRNQYFVRSATELKEHAPWLGRNARVFQKLLTYLEAAEDQLRLEITEGVVDGLKAKWQNPDLSRSPVEKKTIKLIQKYVSLSAIERAMPYIALAIDEDGIREVRKKDGVREEEIAEKPFRNRLLIELRKDCQMALKKLTDYLDSVATTEVFPSYASTIQNIEPDNFSDSKSIIL